ncbi:hypothetical protein BGZ65_009637, partial [Modicella reniformis]
AIFGDWDIELKVDHRTLARSKSGDAGKKAVAVATTSSARGIVGGSGHHGHGHGHSHNGSGEGDGGHDGGHGVGGSGSKSFAIGSGP